MSKFNQLRIIHVVLIVGVSLYAIMVNLFMVDTFTLVLNPKEDLLLLVFFGLGLFPLIGTILYRKKMDKLTHETPTETKFESYQQAKITLWATIEGATLFSVTALLITSNLVYLVGFIIFVALFIITKPNKPQFVNDAKLSNKELLQFI